MNTRRVVLCLSVVTLAGGGCPSAEIPPDGQAIVADTKIGASSVRSAHGGGPLVRIQPIVLQAPSGLDTASSGALPTSVGIVDLHGAFVTELWVQQTVSGPMPNGISCVFTDLTFDPASTTCNGIALAPGFLDFSNNGGGSIDNINGLVDELGGCTFTSGLGITAGWVRIATVFQTADVTASGNVIGSGPATTTISLVSFGNVPIAQIEFASSPVFLTGCFSDADCDDANPCTTDTCDAGITCSHDGTGVVGPCDDGLDCTVGDTCLGDAAGSCAGTPDMVATPCDDGDACTLSETCIPGTGVCGAGLAVDCDDLNPCTDDTCDPTAGCMIANNTAPCEDGLFCNGAESCSAGVCAAGAPVDCSDGVACTDDSCNEAADACDHVANDANCPDDGAFCNGVESCDAAADCVSSGDPCAVSETCNAATATCDPGGLTGEGFVLSRNADFSTDDRSFFVTDTIYMLLWSDQVDFNDIARARWELKDGAGVRVRQPFTNHFDGTYTASFALSGLPSNDTDWTWKGEARDNNGVRFRPAVLVTVSAAPPCSVDAECDDGLYCTGVESCDAAGHCVSSGSPCAANETCNEATTGCDPSEFTGEGFILSQNPDFSTDDRAFFATDTIYMILWSDQVDFNNINRARWELKDGAGVRVRQPFTNHFDGTYTASFALSGLPSNDTNWTWKGEAKDNNGVRFRPTVLVTVSTAPPCSVDADCDDGLACNGDELCVGGTCQAGTPVNCDDGVFCNGAETCDEALGCMAGIAVNCADGLACTIDSCNEFAGACDHVPDDAACLDDGVFCNGTEFCDPVGGCSSTGDPCPGQVCDEIIATCVACGVPSDCDDGLFCNGPEICDPLAGCLPGATPCGNDEVCNETTAACDPAPTGPLPPSNLTGQFGETANLGWTPSSDADLNGYNVYRSTVSGGPYTLLTVLDLEQGGYDDESGPPGFYCYIVTAFDTAASESVSTNEVCGTTVQN